MARSHRLYQMYDKRVKIFIGFSLLLLLICLARLVQMQLLSGSSVQDEILKLKTQGEKSRQFKTIRGKIYDRHGRLLATDEAEFHLCISYTTCSIFDDRVRRGLLLKAAKEPTQKGNVSPQDKAREETEARLEQLDQIIAKCELFGVSRDTLEDRMRVENNRIWNKRSFIAWWRQFPNPRLRSEYGSINGIPASVAMADFAVKEPDEDNRIELAMKVDIPDMRKDFLLFRLESDDAVFDAQLAFLEIEGVEILARGRRIYPYRTVACHTLGWVGPATQDRDKLDYDPNDRLSTYLTDEVCGREDGVEYVCEGILRGRRGEEIYDIDQQLIRETETELGDDVHLTLDIELQARIEDYLINYPHEPGCGPGMAAVVIDVRTSEILSMVSLPLYDINRIREREYYGNLSKDPNRPQTNRAINNWYPPGSVIKPVTLIVGLEEGKITPSEIIPCPARPAPEYWPNCWIFNETKVIGHDSWWDNTARNAIKGSCNIYFSHLANRIAPRVLQRWLFAFGYGRPILRCPTMIANTDFERQFRQLSGMISSAKPKGTITSFDQIPDLEDSERRWFGMGQGKLLVTPLQVANAMAVISRGGVFRLPRLFIEDSVGSSSEATDLGISKQTMDTVLGGMHAVVNEYRGTAYKVFKEELQNFEREDVQIYGKTGSTQPAHAWFGGFAEDSKGRSVAITVLVEGGQHGSSDASPLVRDIIQFCVEAGYLGEPPAEEPSQ